MIQELNLSPTGYVILLLIVVWLMIQIVKVPSKIEFTESEREQINTEPAYLERYGAVIQMQGKW